MIKAVSAGGLLIDFNTISVDSFGYPALQANPGGDVGNYVSVFAKFGVGAAIISKVGNDAFGHQILKTVSEIGVDTTGVIVTDNAFTTLAFVTLDDKGDREFSFARKPGADILLSFEEIDLSVLDDADVLHVSSVGMTDEPSRTAYKKLVEYAKSKGVLISFDPNLRIPLWHSLEDAREQMLWGIANADVLKISEEEIEFIYGSGVSAEEGAKLILEKNPNLTVVFATCGEKGCYYRSGEVYGFVPALDDVNVIDTVGAGDIFGASAMYRLLSNRDDELDSERLDDIVGFATVAAGLSTEKHGGIPSIPELSEVETYLKNKEQ